jgi:general secretion pathway protein M
MKQRLLIWWSQLAQREQRLLLICAPVLVLGLFYWIIWQPLHQARQQNNQALQLVQQQLAELRQAKPILLQAGNDQQRTGGSLAQIVSNSARAFNIRVSRMQPQGEQLQLVLEDIAYEQLLPWLHQLHYQNGVRLVQIDLAATDKSGMVRVRRMVIE